MLEHLVAAQRDFTIGRLTETDRRGSTPLLFSHVNPYGSFRIAPGFPGEYQIDFQVPGGVSGDDVPLADSIAGSPADTRTIAIRAK